MSTEGRTSPIQTPICTSCNRTIAIGAKATRFNCPSCGDITVWRCQKCRRFGRQYKCPKCGFMGP
ncbi:MAG: DUF1610 domain-containing protein [Candidatus Bathyarchaeota archaeon]|nr:MAG: DUF1610 domain-containing protein [Candidatus Bathyarchaeota archaeon]